MTKGKGRSGGALDLQTLLEETQRLQEEQARTETSVKETLAAATAAMQEEDMKVSPDFIRKAAPYTDEVPVLAYQLSLLGLPVEEIRRFFSVAPEVFLSWVETHPALISAIQEGQTVADAKVANALFKRATGYTRFNQKATVLNTGEVVRYEVAEEVPPDTAAIQMWLANRQRETWKMKQEVEHNVTMSWGQLVEEAMKMRDITPNAEGVLIEGSVPQERDSAVESALQVDSRLRQIFGKVEAAETTSKRRRK